MTPCWRSAQVQAHKSFGLGEQKITFWFKTLGFVATNTCRQLVNNNPSFVETLSWTVVTGCNTSTIQMCLICWLQKHKTPLLIELVVLRCRTLPIILYCIKSWFNSRGSRRLLVGSGSDPVVVFHVGVEKMTWGVSSSSSDVIIMLLIFISHK